MTTSAASGPNTARRMDGFHGDQREAAAVAEEDVNRPPPWRMV